MPVRRVFVFGGGGWTGSALVPILAARGLEVVAPRSRELDVADEPAVLESLRGSRADGVVNLAAAQPGAAEDALEHANHCGAASVARAAAVLGLRLVHVSTDMVLGGDRAPYADDAPVDPLTDYARSKARGEAAVLEIQQSAVCVRTSLLWDPNRMGRGITGFARRLEAGEPCRLFADEVRCPLPRGVLAEALVRLLDADVRGTLNVAGREAVTRHAWGTRLLAHFDVPGRERVETVRAADLEAQGAPPRPRDLTLDVSRAEALLGMRLPGLGEVLDAHAGGETAAPSFPGT